jgi:secondary thiamine-phosphate synthase enzyme
MLFKHTIKTTKREELVDITSFVVSSVKKSGIKEGIAIVYIPHTTAGILINENADPSVSEDILNFLNKKVPRDFDFKHLVIFDTWFNS